MRTLVRLVPLLLTIATPAFALDVDALMRTLSARREASATFVEEQHLATLDRPLRASGELQYRAPDTLLRHTLKPRDEVLRYEAGAVSVERRGKRTSVDVQRYPQIVPLIESIRATLAGDRAALERLFEITLAGETSSWQLTLVPRETRRSIVREIRVTGRDADVLGVTLTRENGDRTVTTLTPTSR